jgi:hypothetical protein
MFEPSEPAPVRATHPILRLVVGCAVALLACGSAGVLAFRQDWLLGNLAALVAVAGAFVSAYGHRLLPQAVLAASGAPLVLRPFLRPVLYEYQGVLVPFDIASKTHAGFITPGLLLMAAAGALAIVHQPRFDTEAEKRSKWATAALLFAALSAPIWSLPRSRTPPGEVWTTVTSLGGAALGLGGTAVMTILALRRRR